MSSSQSALQRLLAGLLLPLPSPTLRRDSTWGSTKIDVDGIQLTRKVARFRVASWSAQLSSGMERIRAAEDRCGRTLDSFPVNWDERCRSSTAFFTSPLTSWLWNGQSPMLERRVGSQDAIRCCYVWSVFPASPIVLLRRSCQVVDVRRRDVSLNGCLQCIFGADV